MYETSQTEQQYNKAGATSQSEPKEMVLGTMPVCNAFVKGPDGEVIELFQVKQV